MNRIQCQDKPLDLRLSYFSSSKPLVKARQYAISPNLSGEIKSYDRKVQQLSWDCDCACRGQK